jgi:multidrug resistance efflux pump
MKNFARLASALLLVPLLAGCLGAEAEGERKAGAGADLTVRRGPFRERLLLTGELVAERGEPMAVPRTEVFQLQIRWMLEEGVPVKAGQPVVEFDNSQFASQLEEKRLAATDATNELARRQAESKTATAEKRFAVDRTRAELEKAKIEAGVAKDLLPLREYQERQLALRRAETELAKAEDDLAASEKASEADLAVQRITLTKTRREIETVEQSIEALTLRAPRDGVVIAGRHPWEGRKFQEGDTVWPGMAVANLPDLSSMIVQANLSDVDDGRVKPGMRVVCTLDAYPSVTFPGRVMDIAPVAREAALAPLLRSFPVRIVLDKLDARMRPGMSVRVEVFGPEVKNAVLAPRAGLDLSTTPPKAFLAEGGTAEVKLGPCAADVCLVEKGLEPGTRLRVRDGSAG